MLFTVKQLFREKQITKTIQKNVNNLNTNYYYIDMMSLFELFENEIKLKLNDL